MELCEAEEASGVPTRYGNELAESKVIRKQLIEWHPEAYEKWGEKWLERELLARLNWRRLYIDGPCHGDKAIFRREFPLTPQQGFEATGRNCFDLRSVALMRKLVEEEGLQPRRYSYIHNPDDHDMASKFKPDEYGPILVYENRRDDCQYVVAADPALGNPNGDPSAFIVLAVSEEAPYLREIASYNKITKPDVFAELLYYIATFYNTALLGPERNERGGYTVCLKLHKELKYERLYFEFNAYDKKPAEEPGFVTKGTNKATIVAGLDYRIRDAEILLRTPLLLEQLEHFVELENGELSAEPGYNDDLAMSAMIGVNVSLKVHYWMPKPAPPPGSIGDLKKRGVWKNKR
jgi:hypothetical protein